MTAETTAVIHFSFHLTDTQNIKQECIHLESPTKSINNSSQGKKKQSVFPNYVAHHPKASI